MKEFHVNTEVYFGERALDRLAQLHYDRVFIVSDPFVVSSGMIKLVTDPLTRAGIAFDVFTDVVPDPPIEKVISGIAAVSEKKAPCIIAVGGGSAIDTAKAIRIFAGKMTEGYAPHLIAIPTTSGTGSEVTSFAVIADPAAGRKYPLVSESLTPDEAILDEELVKSVPASVTADTGMDVLTHALEAYVSINNNEFSGALAEKAVEIIGQFLYRSYSSNQDTHARRKMHIASCLAGLAFNSASLGLNHGMAHQLGALPHPARTRQRHPAPPHRGVQHRHRSRVALAGRVSRLRAQVLQHGTHSRREQPQRGHDRPVAHQLYPLPQRGNEHSQVRFCRDGR